MEKFLLSSFETAFQKENKSIWILAPSNSCLYKIGPQVGIFSSGPAERRTLGHDRLHTYLDFSCKAVLLFLKWVYLLIFFVIMVD